MAQPRGDLLLVPAIWLDLELELRMDLRMMKTSAPLPTRL
jgi:hypothetical protein